MVEIKHTMQRRTDKRYNPSRCMMTLLTCVRAHKRRTIGSQVTKDQLIKEKILTDSRGELNSSVTALAFCHNVQN